MQNIPVYLFTGFLDSGKTKLIRETLIQQGFAKGSATLLILCEDGEEEYNKIQMEKNDISIVEVEKEELFNHQKIKEWIEEYTPDQIFIEYNGMWEVGPLFEGKLPKSCEIVQTLTCVDSSTFETYLLNMRPMIMEQIFSSDVIIFNRFNQQMSKQKFRLAIKGQNKKAQIVYELSDGTIDETPEELPYDMTQNELTISDMDYAIWYTDIMDNPKNYEGKKITFLGLVYNPKGKVSKGVFIPGRFAMTCCADDVTFLGVKAKYEQADQIEHKSFVQVSGIVKVEYAKEYHHRGPVLYVEEVINANKPEDELIYF